MVSIVTAAAPARGIAALYCWRRTTADSSLMEPRVLAAFRAGVANVFLPAIWPRDATALVHWKILP